SAPAPRFLRAAAGYEAPDPVELIEPEHGTTDPVRLSDQRFLRDLRPHAVDRDPVAVFGHLVFGLAPVGFGAAIAFLAAQALEQGLERRIGVAPVVARERRDRENKHQRKNNGAHEKAPSEKRARRSLSAGKWRRRARMCGRDDLQIVAPGVMQAIVSIGLRNPYARVAERGRLDLRSPGCASR